MLPISLTREGLMGRARQAVCSRSGAVVFVPKKPKLSATQLAEIRAQFDLFDKDKGGAIDATELQQVFRSLGYTYVTFSSHLFNTDRQRLRLNSGCSMPSMHSRNLSSDSHFTASSVSPSA